MSSGSSGSAARSVMESRGAPILPTYEQSWYVTKEKEKRIAIEMVIFVLQCLWKWVIQGSLALSHTVPTTNAPGTRSGNHSHHIGRSHWLLLPAQRVRAALCGIQGVAGRNLRGHTPYGWVCCTNICICDLLSSTSLCSFAGIGLFITSLSCVTWKLTKAQRLAQLQEAATV